MTTETTRVVRDFIQDANPMDNKPKQSQTIACTWDDEPWCQYGWHMDDGVPYCDRCGCYRITHSSSAEADPRCLECQEYLRMSDETTLGDALPREMSRVRDVLMPMYQEIGPAGGFALALMRRDLDAAARAMAEGDAVAMLRSYQALKEYKA